MIRLIFTIVALAVLAAGAAWIANQPGVFVLEWGEWRVEAPLAIAAFGLILGAIALLIGQRFWLALRRIPQAAARWRTDRRQQLGYAAFTNGLLAVAAGDGRAAQAMAAKSERLLTDKSLPLLLAAQAAQISGDETGARLFFERMLRQPEIEFIGVRGLLASAGRAGDDAKVRELTQRALQLKPKSPWAVQASFDLQIKDGLWVEADATLKGAMKRRIIPAGPGARSRAVVMLAQAMAYGPDRAAEAVSLAQRAHKLAPDLVPAAVFLTERYRSLGSAWARRWRADRVIARTWAHNPHPALANAWLQVHAGDRPKRLAARAKSLASAHAQHLESRLLLARVAYKTGQFEQARGHLSASRTGGDQGADTGGHLGGDSRALSLLAELDERQYGDYRGAHAARMQADAQPPATWTCSGCGHRSPAWTPKCPQCAMFDSMAWPMHGPKHAPRPGQSPAQAQLGKSTAPAAAAKSLPPIPTDWAER
jgi:HemY protein